MIGDTVAQTHHFHKNSFRKQQMFLSLALQLNLKISFNQVWSVTMNNNHCSYFKNALVRVQNILALLVCSVLTTFALMLSTVWFFLKLLIRSCLSLQLLVFFSEERRRIQPFFLLSDFTEAKHKIISQWIV